MDKKAICAGSLVLIKLKYGTKAKPQTIRDNRVSEYV